MELIKQIMQFNAILDLENTVILIMVCFEEFATVLVTVFSVAEKLIFGKGKPFEKAWLVGLVQ